MCRVLTTGQPGNSPPISLELPTTTGLCLPEIDFYLKTCRGTLSVFKLNINLYKELE